MIKTSFICDICKDEFTVGSTSIAKIILKESNCKREMFLIQPEITYDGAHICHVCVDALKTLIWKE